jgi:hypothetical protein
VEYFKSKVDQTEEYIATVREFAEFLKEEESDEE